MAEDKHPAPDPFDVGTYEGHELAQLHHWMSIPLSEKLEWLENAQAMVDHLTKQAEARGMKH